MLNLLHSFHSAPNPGRPVCDPGQGLDLSLNPGHGRRRSQKGFTLIEVLIVVSIAAAMLFGIFTVANRVTERQAVSEAVDGLNLIASETRTAFRAQGNYAGVDAATLIRMNIPPASMVQGTTIVDPWGQTMVVLPEGGTPPPLLRFTFPAVPQAVCNRLVTAAEGSFDRVLVNAVEVKPLGSRLNVAAAGGATACGGAAGATMAVHFVMRR